MCAFTITRPHCGSSGQVSRKIHGRFRRPRASTARKIAEVLATEGERDQAQAMITNLLKEDSRDAEARALRATLWLASGDLQQARAAISELQELAKVDAFQCDAAL